MTYEEMMNYFSHHNFSTYERDNYDKFLDKKKFFFPIKAIHISGSNGKGSTANFIYNAYLANGYKVGLYTSPFLEDVTEMISVSGKHISKDEYVALFNELKDKFEKFGLSSFEMQTYIAFEYFLRQSLDLVAIEVGMGGFIDATNVIDNPLLAIITNISLEHTAYLGRSISEIAYNKAGIIKTDEEIQARKFASVSAEKNKKEEKDTEEEKPRGRKPSEKITEAKPMGRPKDAKIMGDEPVAEKPVEVVDTTRISVESQAQLDSLNRAQAIQDSIDATMKKEYVPVTSIIHTLDFNSYDRIYQAYITPNDYYANTYYNGNYDNAFVGDSIYDQYKYSSVKNTVGLALLEGFNKYVKAGLKVFASFEYRKYQMPEVLNDGTNRYVLNSWTGHCTNIGAQLAKTQGKTLHFNLAGELGVTGLDAGSLAVDFSTDVNFALFGDTVQLAAKSFFRRTTPRFFQNQYHSKHLWWDQSLNSETRTHIEGLFSYQKTNTQLRVAIDEIQNYTYFGMSYTLDDTARKNLTAGVYQSAGNINVLTAQVRQNFQWGIINWENILTYQNSSNTDVLPLPALNLWSNLFLKFKVARVLSVELGGCLTYFTNYYAPDYVPQLSQFAIQQNANSRVELGGYPWVDVYANMHLKRARFFIAYSHVNGGSGTKNYFLAPHYPTNGRIMHMGISWNFYN